MPERDCIMSDYIVQRRAISVRDSSALTVSSEFWGWPAEEDSDDGDVKVSTSVLASGRRVVEFVRIPGSPTPSDHALMGRLNFADLSSNSINQHSWRAHSPRYYQQLRQDRVKRKMSSDCGSCLAKYLLCAFNFLLFIIGGCVLGVGIWLVADEKSFIKLLEILQNVEPTQPVDITVAQVMAKAAYILIVAGALVFLVSFLGYCGALRESRCLLTTYGLLLLLILILEIVAGGLAAAYRVKTEETTKNALKKTINLYYNKTEEVTRTWDYVMETLECCGVEDGLQDFKIALDGKNIKVPKSCCRTSERKEVCQYSPTASNSYIETGCYHAVINWINKHFNVVIGVGVGLGLVQLLGIFLAFCLVKSIDLHIK